MMFDEIYNPESKDKLKYFFYLNHLLKSSN